MSGVLKSPTIIVLFLIFPFILVSICLTYCGAPMFGAKYWSFSFNISLSNENPGLISFRMDWLDLLAVQGTLKSLLQHPSSKEQKINKETQTLNDTIDQLDLIDIYRTFHPQTMNFTFFSSAHGTFSRIDHILGHKSSLGKFRKIEIIPSIFSDHNAVRLDLNYRGKTIKNSNIWRLNNTLHSGQKRFLE